MRDLFVDSNALFNTSSYPGLLVSMSKRENKIMDTI